MLGRSFLLPVHPHFHAPPLCLSFSSFTFSATSACRGACLPACLPLLSPLFSFLPRLSLLSLSLSLSFCLSVRRPLCPGIVQLKCRNCPLEFILKFVARQPFIYHVPTVFRDTFRFDRDIEPSLDSSLPPSLESSI